MADSGPPANSVKKETMLLVAAICLLVGFLGGVVFSVFRLAPGGGTATATRQEGGAQQPRMTPEQARKALTLEKEVAAHPKNTRAWIGLGQLYFDTGEAQKAIQAYIKALKLDPSDAPALSDLGVMYRRTGQFDKALETFDRAIKLDPTLAQPRFNKGIVLMFDLHREKEALQAWENLLKIHPDATAPNGQPLRKVIESYRQEQTRQPAKPPQGLRPPPQPAAGK